MAKATPTQEEPTEGEAQEPTEEPILPALAPERFVVQFGSISASGGRYRGDVVTAEEMGDLLAFYLEIGAIVPLETVPDGADAPTE